MNDLLIKYNLWDTYNLFFNITNVFDEKYETVGDYSQMDRSFNIGLKKEYTSLVTLKQLSICLSIFIALSLSEFIPHPPNFTSLLALSFYVPAILEGKLHTSCY